MKCPTFLYPSTINLLSNMSSCLSGPAPLLFLLHSPDKIYPDHLVLRLTKNRKTELVPAGVDNVAI